MEEKRELGPAKEKILHTNILLFTVFICFVLFINLLILYYYYYFSLLHSHNILWYGANYLDLSTYTPTNLIFFEDQKPLKKVLKALKRYYFEGLTDP